MKAYVLKAINDFVLEEVQIPQPGAGEVLVKVMAAGICGSDIPRVYQTGTYSFPLIPGHEFAGEVVGLGEGVKNSWMGKRVGVFPLLPCGDCEQCRNKAYEMCRKYSYLGSRCDGGFAEYVKVPEWNLLELPETVSYEAAAMLEPMCVAAHAIRDMQIRQDEIVVVCGLGTIGLMVLMLLKEQGVENVLAIGNKTFQKEVLEKIGFDTACFCNAKETDADAWVMEKTEGKGADVYFECVGKEETIMQAVSNTKPGGRIRLVGNPHSDIAFPKNIYWKILRNQLSLSGTWNSSFTKEACDDWHFILELLEKKSIQPELLITHKYKFEHLLKGFELMRDKSEEYIKVMCLK